MASRAWAAWVRRSLALTAVIVHVRRDVAALGAHRPGHVPVPRVHQPAVRGAGAGLPARGAVARAVAVRLGAGARRRGAGHPGRAAAVAAATAAVHAGRRGEGEPGRPGVRRHRQPAAAAERAGLRRRARPRWSVSAVSSGSLASRPSHGARSPAEDAGPVARSRVVVVLRDRWPASSVALAAAQRRALLLARRGSEPLALVALLVLAIPAWMALRARDPRRFAVGVLVRAALLFLSRGTRTSPACRCRATSPRIYQGLLPTWN